MPRDTAVKRVAPTPREQARTRAARRAVVRAATDLFGEHGYVATTVEAICDRSAVPAPTVYRLFAGKIGILQAVLDLSIGGDDQDVAVQDRPPLVALFADPDADPAAVVAGVVATTTAINTRSNAVYHVLAAAAASDESASRLLSAVTEQRRTGQRQLTRSLARRGALRPGLSEPRAADIVYALLAPEIYRMLVVDRGWRPRRYQQWLTATLREQLLDPSGAEVGRPPADTPTHVVSSPANRTARDRRVRMEPHEHIDELISAHPDWRGATLAEARRLILAVDPGIVEEWKWMGSPVWELDGILVVGDIFKSKVKLGFLYGASLDDPEHVFNGELGGNQRRSYELYEGDELRAAPFQDLVRAAIARNRAKPAKAAKAAKTAARKRPATT